MIRRRHIDQRLDALDGRLTETLVAVKDRTHHDEILAARIQRADERAAVHVEHAKDQLAAVNAELAKVRGETILHGITDLRRERDEALALHSEAARERDEWRGRAEHAEAELTHLTVAWRARGEQVDDYCRQLGEAERRVEELTDERDEARRQHDLTRIARDNALRAADGHHELLQAAADLLDHGDHEAAIAARPRGGSRTRTRARFAHLAELVGWSAPPD